MEHRDTFDAAAARRDAQGKDQRATRVIGGAMALVGVFGAWLFWPSSSQFDRELFVLLDSYVFTAAFVAFVFVFFSVCVGIAGLVMVVAPSFEGSKRSSLDEAGSTVELHRDRGDGYCAQCYQPWPCNRAR